MRRPQVHLDGVLGDAIGVLRLGRHVFPHRRLARPVYGDRTRKDEALHFRLDCFVQDGHRADDIICVIEPPDEVAPRLAALKAFLIDIQ